MPRNASIGAKLNLDKRGFTKELASAVSDSRSAVSQMGQVRGEGGLGGVRGGIERIGKAYTGLRGIVADTLSVIQAPLHAKADYDDMSDSLAAFEGSAEKAAESLAFLRAIGLDQAMELDPLVQAHARIVSLGYSSEQSRDMLRELANAAEFSGMGAEVLDPIVGSFEKMSEKGEVSVKTLMKLGETMPFMRKILDMQFGVKSAADLEKLDLSAAEVFDGVLKGLKTVETAQASMLEKGLNAGDYAKNLAAAGGSQITLPERQVTAETETERASRLAEMQRIAAEKKAAAASALFAKEQELLSLQTDLADAEAKGDKKAIEAAEIKLALAQDLQSVMKETGATEAQASAAIANKVSAERALKEIPGNAASSGADSAKDLKQTTKEDLEISTLRARGKTKQADKKEAEVTEKRRAKELVAGGLDAPTAAATAAQERTNREDEARFEKTGRRSIKGAKSKTSATSFTGLDNALAAPAIDYRTFAQTSKPEAMAKLKSNQGKDDARFNQAGGNNQPRSTDAIDKLNATMREFIQAIKSNQPSVAARTSPVS